MKKILLSIFILLFSNTLAFCETLKFIQVTDVHFPKKGVMGYEGRSFVHAKANFYRAIDLINKSDAEFVVFTGDSVDKSAGEVFDELFINLNKLNKKYYLCLGNHDVNTPNAFTKKDTLEYLKKNTHYKQSGANYYIKLNDKFIAVMLDGTNDTKIDSQGLFSKETLKWLENVLKENTDKKVLIFQHFPLVEPIKDTNYFHKHTTRKKGGYIRLLKKYKNVLAIISGHYHVAGEKEKYGVKHYSTPALFLEKSYYRTFEIDYDNDEINFIETKLMPVK